MSSFTSTLESNVDQVSTLSLRGGNTLSAPLKLSGILDQFKKFDVTGPIGTEFDKEVQLTDWLNERSEKRRDELLRNLAILVSQRGVVFFRSQEGLDIELQKELGKKLGELTGKPKASTLHVHPITKESSELGDEVSVITSELKRTTYKQNDDNSKVSPDSWDDRSKLSSNGWHSDISFEPVPADYSILKIHALPPTGGDTLWSSGYDAYDRLSEPFAKFLEGLSARHEAKFFKIIADRLGNEIRKGFRGNPKNFGDDLEAIHPVIRTNPVTGWKSLYINKQFTKRIIGVSKDESDLLLPYLTSHISQHHAGQVRFKWNKNDLAIWDNRSTYHSATHDYNPHEHIRIGNRVVSIGEAPYFDPKSKSRSDDLDLGKKTEGYY